MRKCVEVQRRGGAKHDKANEGQCYDKYGPKMKAGKKTTKDLPQLEDNKEGGVFIISCARGEDGKKRLPPVGVARIEGTETCALIDTGANVYVMDTSTLQRLPICLAVKLMKARIYPFGSKTPLPLRGVIDATVTNGAREIKTKFHITQCNTGTLLGC